MGWVRAFDSGLEIVPTDSPTPTHRSDALHRPPKLCEAGRRNRHPLSQAAGTHTHPALPRSPTFSHFLVHLSVSSSVSSSQPLLLPAHTPPPRLVSSPFLCIYRASAHQSHRIGPNAVSHTAASEVSTILESRIAGSSFGGDVQETGRVLTIGEFEMNLCALMPPDWFCR
jgi:hypothetical protein